MFYAHLYCGHNFFVLFSPPFMSRALQKISSIVPYSQFSSFNSPIHSWSWLSVSCSAEAGPGGLQVRQRPGGGGRPAEREVLHPAAGGHRDLLVHVEVHPWSQVQAVGLGGGAGETFFFLSLIQFVFFCFFEVAVWQHRGFSVTFSSKISGDKLFVIDFFFFRQIFLLSPQKRRSLAFDTLMWAFLNFSFPPLPVFLSKNTDATPKVP